MRRLLPPLLLLFAGCTRSCDEVPVETGDSTPVVEDTEEEQEECVDVYMKIQGPEAPVVGDQWTVWLWCDDKLLVGACVLLFDPPDFADTAENVATFTTEGTAEMKMQCGSYRDVMEVTVGGSADTATPGK